MNQRVVHLPGGPMENNFLMIMAAMNLVAAGFFTLTAKSVAARPRSSHARLAGTAFTVSWVMLAVMAASDASRLVLAWAPGDFFGRFLL